MESYNIDSNERLNSQLKEEVQETRGAIFSTAEKVTLPKRFTTKALKDRPVIEITDSSTGKTSLVPLFAYSDVRQTLNDLFSE